MFNLAMLNKLRCRAHLIFNQSDHLIQDSYLMTSSADPDQLATNLDLYCLQRQGIFGFSRIRVNPS